VLALNVHAGYACRRSGACCTAGWPIPVEADVAARLHADGALPRAPLDARPFLDMRPPLDTRGPAPAGAAGVIAPGPDGACPFFEREPDRLCAIQRRLGHDSLPSACRHFPRIALCEADATRVTLSHFCPTAASMLFRDDIGPIEIVAGASGIAGRDDLEGFDARATIPPLLRPGVAMDAASCRLWERLLLDACNAEHHAAEDALARIARGADGIRTWDARASALAEHSARIAAGEPGMETGDALASRCSRRTPGRRQAPRWVMPPAQQARLFQAAVASVPAGLPRPALPLDLDGASRRWVQPAWPDVRRPVNRFLAAHAFGAWSAYLGEGLRTQAAALAVALAVLRVEAARCAGAAGRALDAALLHAAIRQSDLLLRHLSSADTLVASLDAVERAAPGDLAGAMGLEMAA